MIYKGKLPVEVVGEIQHVINNALGPILLAAESANSADADRIKRSVFLITDYIKELRNRSEFSNEPFKDYAAKRGAA